MNRPQGRCRLFHCVSYLPLPSNTCTRWFSRSATYTQPSASQVMLCAMLNSPGSVPGPPQERSSLADGVVPIVGEPDRIVGRHEDAVGTGEHTFSEIGRAHV